MEEKKYHQSFSRLLSALEPLGVIKRQDIAEYLKQTDRYVINNWAKRGVSVEGAQAAQDAGVCSSTWILKGKEPPESQATVNINSHSRQKTKPEELVITEYATGGKMGVSGLVLKDQPGAIKSWTVTDEWAQKNIHRVTSIANLSIVTGFGDSMKPTYNPGDPLLVDTGVTDLDHEGIFFFRVGNEGFIKRLQRIPGQGILVISDNGKYRDWTINADSDFEIIGKIVKAWCGEDF